MGKCKPGHCVTEGEGSKKRQEREYVKKVRNERNKIKIREKSWKRINEKCETYQMSKSGMWESLKTTITEIRRKYDVNGKQILGKKSLRQENVVSMTELSIMARVLFCG